MDIEKIKKQIIFESAPFEGFWTVRFVCKDGFQFSITDKGNSRTLKEKLTNKLINVLLEQKEHKID